MIAYALIGLVCLIPAIIGVLLFIERDINFNFPLVKSYIAETLNENNESFKIDIGSARVYAKFKQSKINIRLAEVNMSGVDSDDRLSVEHVDIEFDIASLFDFKNVEFAVTLSSLPVDIKRRFNNSLEVTFDKYRVFSEGRSRNLLAGQVYNITSLKMNNPKLKFFDEKTELTFNYNTEIINFIYFKDKYVCKTQGLVSQDNLDDALLSLTANFFPKTGKTIIESQLNNFVPSHFVSEKSKLKKVFEKISSPLFASSVINIDPNGTMKSFSGDFSAENFTIKGLTKNHKTIQINNFLVSYKSNIDLTKVEFTTVELESEYLKISGSGHLQFDNILQGRFSFPNTLLFLPENKSHSLEIRNAFVELDFVEGIARIRNSSINYLNNKFDVDGNVFFTEGFYNFSQFSVQGINVNTDFLKYLNLNIFNGFDPIINSVHNVQNLKLVCNFKINQFAQIEYDGSIHFTRGSIVIDSFANEIVIKDGKINFNIDSVYFEAQDINILSKQDSSSYSINLSLTQFKIQNNTKVIVSSDFYIDPFKTEANLTDLLLKLGFETSSVLNYDKYILNDRFSGQVIVEWDNFNFAKFNPKNVFALINFENLNLKIPYLKNPVIITEVEIKISDYELSSGIRGSIDGNPLNGSFNKVFIEDVAATLNLTGGINISNFVSHFSREITFSGDGIVAFNVNIIFPPSQNAIIRFHGDLTNTYLECQSLGFKKEKYQFGMLNFGLTDDQPTNFKFSSGNYELNGFIPYNDGENIELKFTKVKLDDYFQGNVLYKFSKLENFLLIDGKTYDHSRAPKYEFVQSDKDLQIEVNISELKIRSDLTLTDFSGLFYLSDEFYGDGFGRLNNGPELAIKVKADNDRRIFQASSTNAGEVLLESNIYSSGYGGEIEIELVQSPESDSFGSINLRNLRVIGAPFLAKLISLTSIKGMMEVLSSNGMIFENIWAEYQINKDILKITNGIAISPSIGITLSGTREMDQKIINYSGVLSPAYSLNGMIKEIPLIGGVLGGNEGEGAFGINYSAKGKINNPEIRVNPLSFIAPGQFRKFVN